MHTVHFPRDKNTEFLAAAVGIMFSVNDYNAKLTKEQERTIDEFFDSLDLEKKDPKVKYATYGDLMMMVDTNNRWVYKGSVTTPPCATTVYWNVLTTVYPIKKKHLEQF